MQQAIIIGNLGRDPETRYTAKGTAVLSFSVAVNTRIRPSNPDEEWTDHTEWFNVSTWSNTESLSTRLGSGTRVFVQGDLTLRKYQRKDGTEGTSLDIRAQRIEIISRPASQQNGDSAESEPTSANRTSNGASTAAKSVPAGTRSASKEEDPNLDDLPFNLPRHIQEPWLIWRAP